MADFVLDENIFIRAALAEETNDPADLQAAELLSCLQTAHRWVLTGALAARYIQQVSTRQGTHNNLASRMITSLKNVLFDAGRYMMLLDPAPVPGDYDHNDDPIVAAAAAVRGSTLLTLDGRLADALLERGIAARAGFQILSVADAIVQLCNGAQAAND